MGTALQDLRKRTHHGVKPAYGLQIAGDICEDLVLARDRPVDAAEFDRDLRIGLQEIGAHAFVDHANLVMEARGVTVALPFGGGLAGVARGIGHVVDRIARGHDEGHAVGRRKFRIETDGAALGAVKVLEIGEYRYAGPDLLDE